MSFGNIMNGMFGKVQSGLCRLTIDGKFAVKIGNEYKSYDANQDRLTSYTGEFVFDGFGEDFFFLIPVTDVKRGDTIIANGSPMYVTEVIKGEKGTKKGERIKVIDYRDSTEKTILPEHHVFFGNTYFYGKIASLFGDTTFGNGKNNMGNNIMKMMLMKSLFDGSDGKSSSSMFGGNNMLAMMMLMNGGNNGFGGLFDNMLNGMSFGNGSNDTEEDSEDKE